MTFEGFPADAIDFYAELERENTKAWWQANKPRYDEGIRRPMEALIGSLEGEFGDGHVFRPFRDVRFSKDKTPYKESQGGYCSPTGGVAYYVQVSADGLLLGGGAYSLARDQLARYRTSVSEDLPGEALEKLIKRLQKAGFELGGEQVATRPRGVPADHPRLELLRHKGIHLTKHYGDIPWMHTGALREHLIKDWRALRPFVEWLEQYVGASDEPRR